MAPDGWSRTRLGDLAEIKHGWPFKSEFFNPDLTGHPIVVSIGNFTYTGGFRFESTTTKEYRSSYPKSFELSPGDILLVMTCQTVGGEILGIPAKVPDDGRLYLHNQRLGKVSIKDSKKVSADYLYWVFLWREFNRELVRTATGSKILHTAPARIEAFTLDLPPVREQAAIAQVLGTLDDKIELNRRMNETLESIARELFKSWFVDFDPIRAKAESRETGLPEHLFDLFPDSFEDSELGMIPKGWRIQHFSDISNLNAQTLGREDFLEAIDYIEISEVMRGNIGTITRYERGSEPSRARRRLRHGDTVLSTVRPDRGAYFLCLEPPETLIASTGFVVLSPRQDHWAFLYLALTQDSVGKELGRLADGGTYPAIRPETVGGLLVVEPTDALLNAFELSARPLLIRMEENRHQMKTLAALRDTLLPKLVSGELRIKDAERILETASNA